MAINFPSSPVNGQLHTEVGITWVFVSSKGVWQISMTGTLAVHTHPQSEIINLVTDLAAKAALSHTHTAANISDSTAAGRAMLLAANAASQTALLSAFTSALKGLVPLSGGGTVNFLRADGSWQPPGGGLTIGTEQSPTSGTTVDFTGIPAGVKRITVMFNKVSHSGPSSNTYGIQLGDAGGIEETDYTSGYSEILTTGAADAFVGVTRFLVAEVTAIAQTISGQAILSRMNAAHVWTLQGSFVRDVGSFYSSGGIKQLSAELTQIRVISNGAYDAGSLNISYE